MRVVTEFPHRVRVIELTWITARDDWRPEVRARCVCRGTPDAVLVDTDLDVFDGAQRIFCRSWADGIQRDLM